MRLTVSACTAAAGHVRLRPRQAIVHPDGAALIPSVWLTCWWCAVSQVNRLQAQRGRGCVSRPLSTLQPLTSLKSPPGIFPDMPPSPLPSSPSDIPRIRLLTALLGQFRCEMIASPGFQCCYRCGFDCGGPTKAKPARLVGHSPEYGRAPPMLLKQRRQKATTCQDATLPDRIALSFSACVKTSIFEHASMHIFPAPEQTQILGSFSRRSERS